MPPQGLCFSHGGEIGSPVTARVATALFPHLIDEGLQERTRGVSMAANGVRGAATASREATPRKEMTPASAPSAAGGSTVRGASASPADGKTTAEAASLSESFGGLVLTEKERQGFIFSDPGIQAKTMK